MIKKWRIVVNKLYQYAVVVKHFTRGRILVKHEWTTGIFMEEMIIRLSLKTG
jgi:hypothetical protein